MLSNCSSTENQILSVVCVLESGNLIPQQLSGSEYISKPFEYNLKSVIEAPPSDFSVLLGSIITIKIQYSRDSEPQYINGIVFSISELNHQNYYSIIIKPQFSLLTMNRRCRVFQDCSVIDIAQTIFIENNINDISFNKIKGHYSNHDCITQYNESDYNFISRLLKSAGLFYFFMHTEHRHTLQVLDNIVATPMLGDIDVDVDKSAAQGFVSRPYIHGWLASQQLGVSSFTQSDFDPDKPSVLLVTKAINTRATVGIDYYHYPGDYQDIKIGQEKAQIKLEAELSDKFLINAESNDEQLRAGSRFRIKDNSDGLIYLIRELTLQADQRSCSNVFIVQTTEKRFHVSEKFEKPVMHGVQTAVVAGPLDNKVYTDKRGRIKVRFHWDSSDNKTKPSTCWLRVMQTQAGSGWGHLFIPRVGHEVVVSFINGDVDRPIVIGCVYNANHMPPYNLPKESEHSGFKSPVNTGGKTGNEFTFIGKKGSESINIIAQKDYIETVANDSSIVVHGNCSLKTDGCHIVNADKKICLSVKGSRISVEENCITISASSININPNH